MLAHVSKEWQHIIIYTASFGRKCAKRLRTEPMSCWNTLVLSWNPSESVELDKDHQLTVNMLFV